MNYRKYLVFTLLFLSACSWLPGASQEPTTSESKAPVQMISGGLLLSRTGTPELGLTLVNSSEQMLWVGVHFHTPNGLTDCVLAKELEPASQGLYWCAQPEIQAESDYRIDITVFSDLAQSQLIDTLNTEFRFTQEDIEAAGG